MSDTTQNHESNLGIILFFVLVGLFLLALPLMFIHPGWVIILFWTGLLVLAAAALFGKLFRHVNG